MREAAIMAGIQSTKLTIAYEPEAAALCCLNLLDPVTAESVLETGTQCIVVDAGGGTVDYTVFQVTGTHQLVVKHAPSGGPWGGITVDERFMELLKDILGEDVYGDFIKENREDYITLYREFEDKKRNINEDKTWFTIRVPASMAKLCLKMNRKSSEKYKDRVKIINDKLRIDTGLIRACFKTPCNYIINHTKELLLKKECKDTTTLLLVGGFMESKVLQKEIKKNFPKLSVIIPVDPELAVLKGAVLFGHNSQMIKSRVVRHTYGVKTHRNFDGRIHPEYKKETIDGIDYCKDIFHIHVRKDQTLHVGEPEMKQTYTPTSATQTELLFRIFVSTEKDPEFVTDSSCSYVGKLTIDIPDTTGGLNREVYVQMSFGETEITVEATEEKTGKTISANFNFLG